VTAIGVSASVEYFPIILRENGLVSYLTPVKKDYKGPRGEHPSHSRACSRRISYIEDYWIRLEKVNMAECISKGYSTYIYLRMLRDFPQDLTQLQSCPSNMHHIMWQSFIRDLSNRYVDSTPKDEIFFVNDLYLLEDTKNQLDSPYGVDSESIDYENTEDHLLLKAIHLLRKQNSSNEKLSYWVAKECIKSECIKIKSENNNMNVNWKNMFSWVQEMCVFEKCEDELVLLQELLFENWETLEAKIIEILESYEARMQQDSFEDCNDAGSMLDVDEKSIKMTKIGESNFFKYTPTVINCASSRLVNYLQRMSGFLVDLLFLCGFMQKMKAADPNASFDSQEAFKSNFDGMKKNSQILLATECSLQALLTNITRVQEYSQNSKLKTVLSSLGEVHLSTDLIAVFYNNFEPILMKLNNNGYTDNLINDIIEYSYIMIRGNIPDQYPTFLRNISLYLLENSEFQNFGRFEVMVNEFNPYFDYGRAVMAFEEGKTQDFIRYIFYVASYVHMGKWLDLHNTEQEKHSWFLRAPWCKMNSYMHAPIDRNYYNFNITEFFRIVFDQFSKKNPKIVSALGMSLINLKYVEEDIRKDYARLIIDTLMDEGNFKVTINLIEGLEMESKNDLWDKLIRKMFAQKSYEQIKKFCIYHPNGAHIKHHIFDETIKMIQSLKTLFLKKPTPPVASIDTKMSEIYTRFTILYQIYTLEDNPKQAGQQMLIVFRELACIYTNHEDLIPPQNKQTLLKYKFNAINLALLCLNETEDCNGYSLPVTKLDFTCNNFGIYTSLLEDKDIVESVFFVSQQNLNSF
jgi:hypothetical protein